MKLGAASTMASSDSAIWLGGASFLNIKVSVLVVAFHVIDISMAEGLSMAEDTAPLAST
jgi:hypothetical protein